MKKLEQSEPLLKRREEETQRLARELVTCMDGLVKYVVQAGKLVGRLVERIWNGDDNRAYEALIKFKPMDRPTFDALLNVNRGLLLPDLVCSDAVCVPYLRGLPIEEQKRYFERGEILPVYSKNGAIHQEYLEAKALRKTQCERIFVKVGRNSFRVRSLKEQEAMVRKQELAEARNAQHRATWFIPHNDSIELLAPRRVKRAALAELLYSIVLGSGAADITPKEVDLANLIKQRIGK